MAPSTVERERGARQQKYNDIGNQGRMTGVKPPTNVPRDSTGNEHPSAYFNSDDAPDGDDDNDPFSSRPAPAPRSVKRKQPGNSQTARRDDYVSSSQAQGGAGRRGDRPDLYVELGERGRKTGVQIQAGQRDDEGFEGVSNYFNSSPGGASTTTAAGGRSPRGSTAKKSARKSLALQRERERDEQEYGDDSLEQDDDDDNNDMPPLPPLPPKFGRYDEVQEDEFGGPTEFGGGYDDDESMEQEQDYEYSDMQVDDGSSMTPSTFQRVHATNSVRRGPSSLRQSITASQAQRALGSNDDSDDDEADAEEVRQIMVSASQTSRTGGSATAGGRAPLTGSGRKSIAAGDRIRELPGSDGDQQPDYDDDDDEQQEENDEDDGGQHISRSPRSPKGKGKARASNASTRSGSGARGSPLVKLGKNGKPIAADGGGGDGGRRKSSLAGTSGGKGKGKGKEVARSESPRDGVDNGYEYEDDGGVNGYDDDDDRDAGIGDQNLDRDRDGSATSGDEAEEERARAVSAAQAQRGGKSKKKGKQPASKEIRGPKKAASATASNREIVTNYARKRARAESHDEDGVRRSNRQRLEPLEYWRNERVVYKRRQSGVAIEKVVRLPKERLPMPGDHKKRGGGAGGRSGSARVKSEGPGGRGRDARPEEEGVDDATDPDGLVWSWEGDAEVSRRIAFTAKMIDPRPTYNNKFAFQKIFTELDYLAGGILQIPAGAEKPTKPAKDNSYMFYCIEGSVSVVVHRTRFAIGPGATFFVPRGNSYSITATSNRDVKLFFTQGRRVLEEPDGSTRPDTMEDSRRVSMSQQQLQQAGAKGRNGGGGARRSSGGGRRQDEQDHGAEEEDSGSESGSASGSGEDEE